MEKKNAGRASSHGKADKTQPKCIYEESQQDIEFRKLAALNDIPNQLTECLIQCGYNTASAVAQLQDLSPVEQFLRDNHFLFKNSPKRHCIYGLYSESPENFSFLPGHKMSVATFIEVCKTQSKSKRIQSHLLKSSSSHTVDLGSSARSISCKDFSDSPDEPLHDDTEPPVTPSSPIDHFQNAGTSMKPADIRKDIENKLESWSQKHVDDEVRTLTREQHYKIVVKEILVHENIKELGLHITLHCSMCSHQVKLQMRRNTIAISNATRHLMNCIKYKKDKSSKRKTPKGSQKPKGSKKQKGAEGNNEMSPGTGHDEATEEQNDSLNISEGSMEAGGDDHAYSTTDSASFSTDVVSNSATISTLFIYSPNENQK